MRMIPIAVIVGALVLSACSAKTAEEPADTPADASASSTAAAAPAAEMPGTSAEEHAATTTATTEPAQPAPASGQAGKMPDMDHGGMPGMDHAAMQGGVQAGWYRGGSFQPCGSTQTYRVDSTADIEAKIRAGKMSASDPVYVRLEGSVADGGFKLTRVAQVGSPTPVRDCPMTGTTIQK
ncbi:MAG: hypothetical protein ACOY37_03985 [Pseudomonadota bacterium]